MRLSVRLAAAITLAIVCSTAVAPPWALKQETVEVAGLEDTLTDALRGDPTALKTAATRLARAVGLTPASPAAPVTSPLIAPTPAGAEERQQAAVAEAPVAEKLSFEAALQKYPVLHDQLGKSRELRLRGFGDQLRVGVSAPSTWYVTPGAERSRVAQEVRTIEGLGTLEIAPLPQDLSEIHAGDVVLHAGDVPEALSQAEGVTVVDVRQYPHHPWEMVQDIVRQLRLIAPHEAPKAVVYLPGEQRLVPFV